MGSSKGGKIGSLSSGRPPLVKSSSKTMSRKASRSLINRHHQLEKSRRQALSTGDDLKATELAKEMEKMGGIEHYQRASLQGQSLERGGDTSKILLGWLPLAEIKQLKERPRCLEIGALSTSNACSTSGLFDMTHIDLNSQEPRIEQQDFMERPLPQTNAERFDIISLSLVVNFVPDHAVRGEMLRRTASFLRDNDLLQSSNFNSTFPSLFLVLPRSCTDNSRYFTEERLSEIMSAIGYVKLQSKLTQKLTYSLWRREKGIEKPNMRFGKQELNPGKQRNNFAITLKRTNR